MSLHRPFLKGSAGLQMGVKALDEAQWIEIDDQFGRQMAERRRLLTERPGEVVDALPGSEAGQEELLALLLLHLAAHYGDRYRMSADGVEEVGAGEWFSRGREAHAPLMLAGRLVQEDFCLLQRGAEAYHLVAAVLCFPAHWRLKDKLGLPLIDVHAPVPDFAEELGQPITRLFERLTVERPVQRLNWSLVDRTDLYLPPAHREAEVEITADNAGEKLWLRVERQTLRRLPACKDIVFGIRTHLTRLDEAIDDRASADALIDRLRSMPAALLAYKNLARIREPLISYLQRQSF